MSRTIRTVALCTFCVVLILPLDARAKDAAAAPGAPNQTERAEPQWQLFLDNHVIARSTGFQRVIHHPRPRGVILEGENDFEWRGVSPLYVGPRKAGGYEMYYRAHGNFGVPVCYAISEDGLHWEKPLVNQVETVKGKVNNIAPCAQPWDLGQFGNVRDPSKRFAICLDTFPTRRGEIYFCGEPPDFMNDPNWRDRLVKSGGHKPGPYNNLEFWDDIHQQWVGMRQAPNHAPTRCTGRYAAGPSLTGWRLDHYLYPDAEDSTDPRFFHEAYGMRSIYLEGFVLGFVEWFIGDRTHPNPEFYKVFGKHTTDEGLIGKGVSKGTMEIRIVTSRDGGKTWDRTVSRQPWIPHGKEQDSLNRLVRIGCPPLRKGDEDWFYCTGYDGDHTTGAGYYHDRRQNEIRAMLYTQRRNRYVSLTTGNTGQILITKPIEVTGKTLQLNVDATRGEVKVAVGIDKWMSHKTGAWPFEANLPHWMVLDRWERTHLEKGFRFEDCEPVRANSTQHDLKFQDASFESLLGKKVRLYIWVRDADLYGFRFK